MSNKITGSDLERLINEAMGLKVEADSVINESVDDLVKRISGLSRKGELITIDGIYSSQFKLLNKEEVEKVIDHLNSKSRTFKNLKIKFEDFKDVSKGSENKTNKFVSNMSNRDFKLINSELLPTKGLFSSPWDPDTPIPDELKVGNYPTQSTSGALKSIASFNEPKDLVTDADVTAVFLKGGSKERLNIKKWLDALIKSPGTSEQVKDAANAMVAKFEKTKPVAMGDPEFDKSQGGIDPYKPDLSIKPEYRGRGEMQRPPKHIEEIFSTFRGINQANTVEERLKLFNNLVVDFTSTGSVIEEEEKKYTDIQDSWKKATGIQRAADFSKLMVLDFFKQIANDMGRKRPADAGSVFESFLALLVNGTVEGGTLDFDDVVAYDSEGTSLLSLKLLSTTTPVTQAEKTVRQFFEKYGKEARIKYIVAYKDMYGDGDYNEFPIYMQTFGYEDIYKDDGSFKVDFDDEDGYEDVLPYGMATIVDPQSGPELNLTDPQKYSKAPAAYIPPGEQIYKTSAQKPDLDTAKGGKELKLPLRQKSVPKGQELKKSTGAGTIVFGHKHIQAGKELGRILIPKDLGEYDNKMKESFDSISESISGISKNLELFKSRITSFFASEDTGKRTRYANESYKNIEEMQSLMNTHIFVVTGDNQQKPMFQDTADKPNPNLRKKRKPLATESKITADFLKKLISESFKK